MEEDLDLLQKADDKFFRKLLTQDEEVLAS
jgi:hypothetical protein